MASRNRNKLLRLFDVYAANASLHFPQLRDCFLCPLCLREFSRQAIDEDLLSVEHVIPEKLGGRLKTMTCRRCNNSQGSSHDAELVNFMRSFDIRAGLIPAHSRFTIGCAEITGNLYFPIESDDPNKQRGWEFDGVPKASKRGHPELCDEELSTGTREFKVSVSRGYKRIPSQVAFIRSAYLMMFYYFGYAYIKYELAKPIRDQIANISTPTEILNGIIRLNDRLTDGSCLAILRHPVEIQCFFALFCLRTEVEHYWAVALPGFSADWDMLYKRCASYSNHGMEWATIPYRAEFVSDPQFRCAPELLWHNNSRRQ